MKRNIKKQFWFNREEAEQLKKKARKACLTEAALVRLLVKGYEPKEKPDDRFYDFTRQLNSIADNIQRISNIAYSQGIDDESYLKEVYRLHQFQADLEQEFIYNGRYH